MGFVAQDCRCIGTIGLRGKGRYDGLQITNLAPGASAAPLARLHVAGAVGGEIRVSDGLGRCYAQLAAEAVVSFTVAGAVGYHRICWYDAAGTTLAHLHFQVAAHTRIDDAGGAFGELLQILHYTMLTEARAEWSETNYVRWNGRIYRFLVRWLRDHVHVLKGMKYFTRELRDGIDLYHQSQRADGLIWDNVYPRSGPNYWDVRFAEGGFIEPFADGSAEFKRIPVEADVEYLFVEGLYATWQATGDDGWMVTALDAAVRALDYSIASPYRWSERFGLIKRGYTIDTWDFQAADDSVVAGDPMRIDPARTRFGVMFGDNTGYVAACRMLATMLAHAGRTAQADAFRQRASAMMQRLTAVSWNGRYFTHHVPEDATPRRDLGVDEQAQVSLSNAYSLNRGLTHAQCVAIIGTYQQLGAQLPPGSPGEWYTIFPPFQRGFGNHNAIWQYMNGGVTPIVAGELAHGAFEHGFEQYGVDILRRLLALGQRHGGVLHAVYTGAMPAPATAQFTPLDLAAYANIDTAGTGAPGVAGWTGEGDNDLHALPAGRQLLAGIPFDIPDPATNGRRGAIGLRAHPGYYQAIDLPVGAPAAAIYLLHTVSETGTGGVGGTLTLHYADGSSASVYIVRGVHVSGWWFPGEPQQAGRRMVCVAWRGSNRHCPEVGLLACGIDNPHPDKTIARITLTAAVDGGFWGVLGLTCSNQPAYFPPNPISYGIPNSWAAAAVVYALIEGLAGVVDSGVAFNQVLLTPRWAAAEVTQVAATVAYPESGGYIAYQYHADLAHGLLTLEVTGSGRQCTCQVLLPAAVLAVREVRSGARLLDFSDVTVEGSRYLSFALELPGPHLVTIVVE